MMSAFTIYWLMLVANNTKLAYPYVRFLLLVAHVDFYVFYQLVYYANMYSANSDTGGQHKSAVRERAMRTTLRATAWC